jgi:hypothetical protein
VRRAARVAPSQSLQKIGCLRCSRMSFESLSVRSKRGLAAVRFAAVVGAEIGVSRSLTPHQIRTA